MTSSHYQSKTNSVLTMTVAVVISLFVPITSLLFWVPDELAWAGFQVSNTVGAVNEVMAIGLVWQQGTMSVCAC